MFKIVKKLDEATLAEILAIVKTVPLKADVSSYAKGRQRTWLNLNWDLREKKFSKTDDCFRNERLWALIKSIWPEAEIGLLTYSGSENPIGINLHRDDSYADYESWGIQLSGTCEFVYMGGYRNFCWDPEKDIEERRVYTLTPGDVFSFNCKNRHSAIPSIDRYAINLWKVSKKFRKEYTDINEVKTNILF